jgi:hypothetical protein
VLWVTRSSGPVSVAQPQPKWPGHQRLRFKHQCDTEYSPDKVKGLGTYPIDVVMMRGRAREGGGVL